MYMRKLAFSFSKFSVCPLLVARPVMRSVVLHSVLFCRHGEHPPGRASHRIFLTYNEICQYSNVRQASLRSHTPCTDRRPVQSLSYSSPSCPFAHLHWPCASSPHFRRCYSQHHHHCQYAVGTKDIHRKKKRLRRSWDACWGQSTSCCRRLDACSCHWGCRWWYPRCCCCRGCLPAWPAASGRDGAV